MVLANLTSRKLGTSRESPPGGEAGASGRRAASIVGPAGARQAARSYNARVGNWVLLLALIQGAEAITAGATRLTLELEEGPARSQYLVDIAPGSIRVEPQGEDVYLILQTAGPTLTVVFREERYYCQLTPPAVRRLVAAGLLRPSWLPWVYRVSPDLVEDLSLERKSKTAIEVFSRKYGRVLASYQWRSGTTADLFFQWRDSYLGFWGEEEEKVDGAQRKRLALYSDIRGLPLVLEERFGFLSRPLTLRVVTIAPAPTDPFRFRPPADFPEKSEVELRWEDARRRLLDWLRPRDRRDPTRR